MTHIVRERTAVDRERVRKKVRYRIIYIAGLLSIFTVFAVQTGTRYVLNGWTQERLERVISQNFHRKIDLGKSTWSLGLNGLVLATSHLRVHDRIGTDPFITSEYAEFGVPLLPLLAGDFEPRSITFTKPTVNAVKIGKFKWNFSDLPDVDALRHVSYFDLRGGTLNVIDKSNSPPAAWSPRVISNANFHLERPFENRTWPFQLSLEMPNRNYKTQLTLTGVGSGSVHEWEKHNHRFDLKAKNVNLSDFRDLFPSLPPIGGLLNANIHGDGIPEKNFNVTAVVQSPVMSLTAPGLGTVTVRNGKISGLFSGNEQVFQWKNVVAQLGRFSLHSQGRIESWRTKNPQIWADVTARNVALSALQEFSPFRDQPILGILGANPNTRLNGTLKLTPDKRATISGGEIVVGRSRISISGYVMTDTRTGRINYSTRNLNLAYVTPAIRDSAAQRRLNRALGLPPSTRISMGGFIDFDGVLNLRGNTQTATVVSKLKNANIALGNGGLRATHINGGLTYDGLNLSFADVTGKVDSGPFRLNGSVSSIPGGPVNLVYQGETLDLGSVRSIAGVLNVRSPLLANRHLRGRLDNVIVFIRGNMTAPVITMSGQPRNFAFQAPGTAGAILITGGNFSVRDNTMIMKNLQGRLGDGTFVLNGTAGNSTSNLVFDGRNLDLSHVKSALQALKVNSPLLAQQLLFGKVHRLTFTMIGRTQKPAITLAAWPKNVYFEPHGSERTLRLVGGMVSYAGDTLTAKDLIVVNARSKATLSARVEQLSGKSKLTDLQIASSDFDLADLASYLMANSTPATVRTKYQEILKEYGLQDLVGHLAGIVSFRSARGKQPSVVSADVRMRNVAFKLRDIAFSNVTGHLRTQGENLIAENMAGKIEGQPLSATLTVHNIKSTQRTWVAELSSSVELAKVLEMIPGERNWNQFVQTDQKIPIRARVLGNPNNTVVEFAGSIAADSNVTLTTPLGSLSKPAGVPISVQGALTYQPGSPTVVTFSDSHVDIGDTRLVWQGTYTFPANPNSDPFIDITVSLPNPVNARTVLALMPLAQLAKYVEGMEGLVGGEIRLTGPVSAPATQGRIDLTEISLPALGISGLSGTIEAPDFFAPREPGKTAQLTGAISEATVNLKRVKVGALVIENIKAKISTEQTPDGQKLVVEDAVGKLYSGIVRANGNIVLTDARPFDLNINLCDIDVERLAEQAFCVKDEVTGKLTASAHVTGSGQSSQQLLASLKGRGHFQIEDGSITRLGELQEKLRQLNLLEEGLFGLNLSNLIAALRQVETGEFDTFSGDFGIANAKVGVERLSFIGDELRLRANGLVDLASRTAELKVYGTIPRVAKGILKGPVGALLQHLSISNILRVATFGLLDDFPQIPILGKLAGGGGKQRAFEFTTAGEFADPESFTKSIVKTFKWLPNQPRATPYPVFGVGSTPEAVPQ